MTAIWVWILAHLGMVFSGLFVVVEFILRKVPKTMSIFRILAWFFDKIMVDTNQTPLDPTKPAA
jgi:hypothetical protein